MSAINMIIPAAINWPIIFFKGGIIILKTKLNLIDTKKKDKWGNPIIDAEIDVNYKNQFVCWKKKI